MDSGAAEVRADLSATQTRRLFMRTGMSSNEIKLPAAAGLTEVRVEGGAGSVRLQVPEGVAARIQGGTAAGNFDVDSRRFPRAGSDGNRPTTIRPPTAPTSTSPSPPARWWCGSGQLLVVSCQ